MVKIFIYIFLFLYVPSMAMASSVHPFEYFKNDKNIHFELTNDRDTKCIENDDENFITGDLGMMMADTDKFPYSIIQFIFTDAGFKKDGKVERLLNTNKKAIIVITLSNGNILRSTATIKNGFSSINAPSVCLNVVVAQLEDDNNAQLNSELQKNQYALNLMTSHDVKKIEADGYVFNFTCDEKPLKTASTLKAMCEDLSAKVNHKDYLAFDDIQIDYTCSDSEDENNEEQVGYGNLIETFSHVIERGESLEYLAELYKTSVDDIKQCNPSLDYFYTGLEINIPISEQNTTVAIGTMQSAPYYTSLCEQADALLNGGDYKKAIKAYSELIDSYSSSLPCTEAYYGRALAYYNRGKWKSAIKDFEVALNDENLSSSTRSQCKNLLSKARTNREQQLEERGQMWGQLFAVAAVTTASVISAKQQAKAANQKPSSSSTSSYGGGSNDDDDDDTTTSPKKKSGSCTSRRYNCGGSGICAMCGGDGIMDGQFGQGANSHKCTNCGGSGRCRYCNN